MLDNRKFTISIGEYGTIVALNKGLEVEKKILISELNETNKEQLIELFTQYKSASTHILLDTTDQNYKKKSYPPINFFDFHKIAKRDLKKETASQEKSFQNYYQSKNQIQKKWECIFVSIPESPEISNWVELLLGMPNKFIGVYALPIETYNLAKSIFELAKKDFGIVEKKNQILSLITHSKVSGVRQVIFFNRTVVFTRVYNYDFNDKSFVSRFEQDIFRANEYLRMILPNFKTQDALIINLLSEDIITKIQDIKNPDLRFVNYSPYQIAEAFNLKNTINQSSSNFSDILIANMFAKNGRKLLKFTNTKITSLSKLYLTLKSIWVLCVVISVATFLIISSVFVGKNQFEDKIRTLRADKIDIEQRLKNINNNALDFDLGPNIKEEDKKNLASEIVDFGKIDEILSKFDSNAPTVFNNLVFIKKYGALASKFSYNIPRFDPNHQAPNYQKKISVYGDLYDPSGDIEVLFRKFDNLGLETKNQFADYNVKYSELSKDIDFSKKYYSFPFDLTMESKK